jgi:carboxylesterase
VQLADQSIRFAGGPVGFLLIHGLGGTPIEMRYVAQGLARAGHTVHVPQLAGHCGTAEELQATTWQHWYESVEIEHHLLRETCDTVVVGGLSMGAILALHHAAQHPQDVNALALYAPSLWLDGWGVPWYSHFFKLVTQRWFANLFPFAERDPWGIKDPRIRALVEQAISSGDSSRAGIAALPGSLMLELRWLVKQVKREVRQVQQPALIVHPREDDRASLRRPYRDAGARRQLSHRHARPAAPDRREPHARVRGAATAPGRDVSRRGRCRARVAPGRGPGLAALRAGRTKRDDHQSRS